MIAIDEVRKLPYVNPNQLAIMGHSHGGWAVMSLLAMDLNEKLPPNLSASPAESMDGVKGAIVLYPFSSSFLLDSAGDNWNNTIKTLVLMGGKDQLTNLERTFVDVLDRPDLTGGWEEIWRSLESIEFFDVDQVVGYVLLLENATTAAKVGFFLEQHKESLMVEDSHLDPLRKLRPRNPHYFVRGKRKDCRWVKDWNLMIPTEILNRSWGEVL